MKYTLPDAVLLDLSAFVAKKIGLHFPKEKWSDLERAIKEIARLNHFDTLASCIHWLKYSLPEPLQVEVLANHLTIGETYFFREKGCFEALRTVLIPHLMKEKEKEKEKTLRVWSAACSSGEEPYSIAMLLTMMIPNINEWNITILASDVNESALVKTKEAVYTNWSFRETSSLMKDRFFKKLDNNRYQLHASIKKMVTPIYLNLSQDCFPDILNGTNAMDLIFCRNVLMYFVPEHRSKVFSQFYKALVNGGHLIVSASELGLVDDKNYTVVNYPNAVFYKKNELKNLTNVIPKKLDFPVDVFEGIKSEPVSSEPSYFRKQAFKKPKPKVQCEDLNPTFDPQLVERQFHELANLGKLNEALAFIIDSIKSDRSNPLLYFYKALLLVELGEHERAISECKNAIYLNPDFVLAYFTIGNSLLRAGKGKEAKKHYDIVLSLLDKNATEDTLPGSEGLSSQRMKEIIQSIQSFNN